MWDAVDHPPPLQASFGIHLLWWPLFEVADLVFQPLMLRRIRARVESTVEARTHVVSAAGTSRHDSGRAGWGGETTRLVDGDEGVSARRAADGGLGMGSPRGGSWL